jgi:hypothetical protein
MPLALTSFVVAIRFWLTAKRRRSAVTIGNGRTTD